MAFGQGSRHRMAYAAESTFGVTPGSPSMKVARITGTTLNLGKETYTSEEIRSDRGISDVRHGTRQVAGDINFELSYGAQDDFLESALFAAWNTDILKAGVTQKSFTIERGQLDIGQYLVYTGCVVNTMKLTIPPSGMVTGTFGMVGKGFSIATSQLAIPTAAPTNSPLASVGGTLTEGGSTLAIVTGLELNLANGVEPNFVVGSNETPQLSYGRSNLSGTISAYFQDAVMLNKFVNEEESSLSIDLVDPAGNTITISIPRLKYTAADVPLAGEGSLQINMPFQALFEGSAASAVVITRDPA